MNVWSLEEMCERIGRQVVARTGTRVAGGKLEAVGERYVEIGGVSVKRDEIVSIREMGVVWE